MDEDDLQQQREMKAAWISQSAEAPNPLYPYIRAWGIFCGWSRYQIQHEQALAVDLGAPTNAIYYALDRGEWRRTDHIVDSIIRKMICDYGNEQLLTTKEVTDEEAI